MKAPLPLRVSKSKDYYSPYLPTAPQSGNSELQNVSGAATCCVTCVAVKDEAAGIKSFFFRAPPGLRHLPGQYASFELQVSRNPGTVEPKPCAVKSKVARAVSYLALRVPPLISCGMHPDGSPFIGYPTKRIYGP